MSSALPSPPCWHVGPPHLSDSDPIGADPVAFGRLLHEMTGGYRLFTSQKPRVDGSTGRPHHQFFQHPEWLSQVTSAAGDIGYFYCFSSFRDPTRADTSNLLDLGALYQDLDWHTHPDASKRYENGDEVLAEVDRRCVAIGFPAPNLVVYSGRGLQIAWLHNPVVAATNLVEWNAAQRSMCEYLSDLGSDPRARPAVHFFKLPGQLNPKSGRCVAVIRQPESTRFQFSDLFGKLFRDGLPAPKARPGRKPAEKPSRVVVDLAAARALRDGKSTAERAPDGLGANADAAGSLIWAPRLRALKTIIEYRAGQHGGCLPEGGRDGILFCTAVALSWVTPDRWRDEYLSIAADYCIEWTAKEALDRAAAVAKRVNMLVDGETLNGENQDPRYRMTNETLREFADITVDEERLPMAAAIARRAIQKSARAHRQSAARRNSTRADREGVTTGLDWAGYREARKSQAAKQAERARVLRANGMTTSEIAAEMGCTRQAAARYVRRPTELDGTQCMLSSLSSSLPSFLLSSSLTSFLTSSSLPSSSPLDSVSPTVEPGPAPVVTPTPVPLLDSELTNTVAHLAAFTREMRSPGAHPGCLPTVPCHLSREPAIREAFTAAQNALADAHRRLRNRRARMAAKERQTEMRERASRSIAEGRSWFTGQLNALRDYWDSKIEAATYREHYYLRIKKEASVGGRCRAWKAAVRHARGLPPAQRRRQPDPDDALIPW
jgi:hypothetical protein